MDANKLKAFLNNPKPPAKHVELSEEEVDFNYIIENKPDIKIVREFIKENVADLVDSDSD